MYINNYKYKEYRLLQYSFRDESFFVNCMDNISSILRILICFLYFIDFLSNKLERDSKLVNVVRGKIKTVKKLY